MTNEERIKNMSIEELAREISFLISDCICCPAFWSCTDTIEDKSCLQKMEDWLNQEAKEE